MTILDACKLGPTSVLSTDVCVVGAGAAGITVAAELDGSSLDVCLLESGDIRPDEGTQSLYELESRGYPVRQNFMSRARYYGGSCNLWAGRSMRLQPLDLAHRAWVPNSGWPIAYEELAEHYPRAARLLKLPGFEMFDPAAYRNGLSSQEAALFADEALSSTVSLWAPRPRRFGAAYRSAFRRSNNIRLVLNANVTRVRLNEYGTSVDSVDVVTLGGNRIVVQARSFVLACGGLENARLLLVSRDVESAGVGNRFGIVGRYFMDHPRAVYGEVLLAEKCRLRLLKGRPMRDGKVQLGIGFSARLQKEEGLLNHYATLEAQFSDYAAETYQSFIQVMKVLLRKGYAGRRRNLGRSGMGKIPEMIYLLTPKEVMPHALYRWVSRLREATSLRRGGGSRKVVYFCEQPPDPESRVTLSSERDALGMNRLELNWRIEPEVTRGVLRLQEILTTTLERAGIGTLTPEPDEPAYSDASHHIGTTRMSEDPRAGVVNAQGQVHGVANLFMAGSSVFPSASHTNPTLTIVALSLRLVEHLKSRLA